MTDAEIKRYVEDAVRQLRTTMNVRITKLESSGSSTSSTTKSSKKTR